MQSLSQRIAGVACEAESRRKDPPLEQRLSLITLGVSDVSRAQAFFEALGWRLDGEVDDETDHVAFFHTGGIVFALWDRAKLAEHSGADDPGGWGGVTLPHNVRSPEEVDAVLAEVRKGGAAIARSGAETFWGGDSGVFIDPDGHPWEVAHNPAGEYTRTVGRRSIELAAHSDAPPLSGRVEPRGVAPSGSPAQGAQSSSGRAMSE